MTPKSHEIAIEIPPFTTIKAKCCKCACIRFIRTTRIGDHFFAECAKCRTINDIYHFIVERPELKSGKESTDEK